MSIPEELQAVTKTMIEDSVFEPLDDAHCHDPSNVILHDGLYYVWFSRNVNDHEYITAHYATSPDGEVWTLRGEALPPGAAGEWDESGNLAPYVAVHDGKYYFFYTGFCKGDLSTRHLGVAVADTPEGPWVRFDDNPIFCQSKDPNAWDNNMMGDSNVIYRDGKWWFYYKSKQVDQGANETQIGVATADSITGPYTKYEGNPIFDGHAFSAWVHRDGVAAIKGQHWPEVLWSQDGINFVDTGGRLKNQSTGFYCPENFGNGVNNRGVAWGFDVVFKDGIRHIQKFTCSMLISENGENNGK